MKLSSLIFLCICFLGSLLHFHFFSLNEVMKIADSFAYLQMSYFLGQFSQEGLGSGWFGFLYSVPIAGVNFFIQDDFFAAKIVNLVLWNISAFLTWKIAQKILSPLFSLLAVVLLFLSASLLSFHIHILSENIYIPLFLWLFLNVYTFIEEISLLPSASQRRGRQRKQIIFIAGILGFLYLTRAEAFIYISSIGILALGLLIQKRFSFRDFLTLGSLFCITFFIFISPYLWHLHSITGEWGLTNKGASNLRQAELRGLEKMDDAGFEQAVAELTADKKYLIAGFAGGMKYEKPSMTGSLVEILREDPGGVFSRILSNQYKLFRQNIPEIFLGDAVKLFYSENPRFGKNPLFLIFLLIPLVVWIFGFWKLFQKEKIFLSITLAFFLPACFFFTLFFTLNRYFIIFLPLFFIIFSYWLSQIRSYKQILLFFFIGNILLLSLLSCFVYWNSEKEKDDFYLLKKEAGLWLQKYIIPDAPSPDIMERFPIVTYYSGVKTRWITPYTNNPEDIRTYAVYNGIEILVVDTMDFQTYRPELQKLLTETPAGFSKLEEFSNTRWQKVILYTVEK